MPYLVVVEVVDENGNVFVEYLVDWEADGCIVSSADMLSALTFDDFNYAALIAAFVESTIGFISYVVTDYIHGEYYDGS